MLAALGEWDQLWVLGDIVGYGPNPDEVVGRLRDLDAVAVQGNRIVYVGSAEGAEIPL